MFILNFCLLFVMFVTAQTFFFLKKFQMFFLDKKVNKVVKLKKNSFVKRKGKKPFDLLLRLKFLRKIFILQNL